MIERASDEELDRLNAGGANGELGRMARRLGDRQLDRLISELEQMRLRLLGEVD